MRLRIRSWLTDSGGDGRFVCVADIENPNDCLICCRRTNLDGDMLQSISKSGRYTSEIEKWPAIKMPLLRATLAAKKDEDYEEIVDVTEPWR